MTESGPKNFRSRDSIRNTGVSNPVRVGGGSFVEGVELSLPGCREKDTVEVYMTYNMAYGDALINFIPEQSPIAVFYTIDSVRK